MQRSRPYDLTWDSPWSFCVRFWDVLTPYDVRQSNEELTADARFDDARYGIADFTSVTGHTFNLGDAGSIVEPHAQLYGAFQSNPRLRAALVITDPGVEALVRRAIELGYPFPANIFTSMVDARDWIASQTQSFRPFSVPKPT